MKKHPARSISSPASRDACPVIPVGIGASSGGLRSIQQFNAELRAILDILRAKVGHDFRCYKPNSVTRRIRRRMTLAGCATYADYAAVLRDRTGEIEALQRDLQIGVTEFFRQPEAWAALQTHVIAALAGGENAEPRPAAAPDAPRAPLASPPLPRVLRLWVPACSTGQEVYTLAMLMMEQVEKREPARPKDALPPADAAAEANAAGLPSLDFQIFATDTDVAALATARAGIYTDADLGPNVSAERRQRFFTIRDGRYQVSRAIRDRVVFVPQNLTADPPFSRLDLISCRNLLIYLDQSVQRKLIALFHSALREGGFLFLGTAETTGDREDLFEAVSKKWRVYRRIGVGRRVRVDIPVRLSEPGPGARPALASLAPRISLGAGDLRQLEDELKVTREELQSTIEQVEISNDQLRASNEEVTAANEELQSANEKLETSKEELQSLNEELNTINVRLQEKVDELKKTQAQLECTVGEVAAAKDRLETVLASITDAYLVLDSDWRLVEINPAAEKEAFARPAAEMLGKAIWELFPQTVGGEVYRQYHAAVATGQPVHFESKSRILDKWWEVHAYPRAGRLEVYMREITARKRAEEAMLALNAELEQRVAAQTAEIRSGYEAARAERQRLYDVLETLPVYVVLLSKDYHVPFANKFFRERFGDSNGRRCFEYLFQRSEPCENCESYKAMKTGAPHHWYWTGPDGRDYDIHDFPFTDADGSPMIMEMGIDITEANKARAALQQLNATLERRVIERTAALAELADVVAREKDRLAAMLNSIADEIWFADDAGQFTLVNPSGAREFALNGAKPVDVRRFAGQIEVLRPDGSPRPVEEAPPLRALRGEVVRNQEESIRAPASGELRHRQVSASPVRDAGGRIVGSISVVRDITDLKRADEALRASRAKLAAALASMTDAVFVADADGQLTEFNDAFVTYHRFKSRKECSKKIADCPLYLDVWFEDGTPAPPEMWAMPRALRGETGSNVEYKLRRKDTGEVWWGSYSFSPIRDSEGRIAGAVAVGREITARKKVAEAQRKLAEDALRLSEQEFRSLAEAVPQIVWATRPDGWNIYFNRRWVEYTGMTMEESYGHGWNKPFHPDDQKRAWDAWQRATKYNEPYSLECRLRRADGVYRWWLVRGSPMLGDNGEILKWFGTCTDIEEIKHAEATLREANDLLEQRVAERTAALAASERGERERSGELASLLEAMPAPVFIAHDPDCLHIAGNRAADDLLRNPRGGEASLSAPGEAKPRHFRALKDGRELGTDEMPAQRAARGERIVDFEFTLAFDDGTSRDVLGYGTPLMDAQGQPRGGILVLIDVTDRKRAEDEVRRRVEELKALNEELATFNRVAVGRELRMIELKKQVNDLCGQLGQKALYEVDTADGKESP